MLSKKAAMTQKEKDALIRELTNEFVSTLSKIQKDYKKLMGEVTKALDARQIHHLRGKITKKAKK